MLNSELLAVVRSAIISVLIDDTVEFSDGVRGNDR